MFIAFKKLINSKIKLNELYYHFPLISIFHTSAPVLALKFSKFL